MPTATSNSLNTSSAPIGLLSNGRYTTLVTAAGTGYSAWENYALTRWSGDGIEDGDGFFIYLRDLTSGKLWSLGSQPVQTAPDRYTVTQQPGCFTLTRQDDGIEACLEVCVAADDDLEIRRITLHNRSDRVRRLELTSCAEVVLNWAGADAAHPAFSKLFIQTEVMPEQATLLAKRRPRSVYEPALWMVHALCGGGAVQYETDRARFVGRGHTLALPRALASNEPLSGTVGNVLDPVFSLRRVIELDAGGSAQLAFLLGAAHDRETALALASRYAQTSLDGVFAAAATREQQTLHRLGMTAEQAGYLQRLAGALLYCRPELRAAAEILLRQQGPLSRLYRHGLPGHLPMVVFNPSSAAAHPLAGELVKAHAYWRTQGLPIALLLLDDGTDVLARYAADPQAVAELFVRRKAEIPSIDLDFIQSFARLVITDALPAVDGANPAAPDRFTPAALTPAAAPEPFAADALRFDNGYGGFSADGTEYVIRLVPDGKNGLRRPPLPWINAVSNETFGFLVSESGAGYTWSRNSREHRLTPWYNDPITDPCGEALYIRDEAAGVFWSPLPAPIPQAVTCEVRHGFGYTRFCQQSQELQQDVCIFVPRRDRVKVLHLRMRNLSSRPRRLSLFAYQRLVLGVLPGESGRFVLTEHAAETGAILVRNPCSEDFADGVTFSAAVAPTAEAIHHTADRGAFIGRYGSPAKPAALSQALTLDGRTGAGLDPCTALQLIVTLPAGDELDCAFLFGEAADAAAVSTVIERYRRPGAIAAAFDEVRAFWRETLTTLQVETPEPAIDLMLNGWLNYQNLSCRLWGRSAFYQSGGAFGFRDQLQDAAALVYLRPDLTRAQILLHAAHQFLEGDVLHWWHPPLSRGIRTRFSDDLLWLPYLSVFYGQTTGDWAIFDEPARFLKARLLAEGEDETYLLPEDSGTTATLYEHCCRALDRSLTQGAHGLPLMGTGDWNDGMNRIGREGRGESVWVGFFLYAILGDFIPLCERRADRERAQRYRTYREQLVTALNTAGWDGAWYRRAYYDDGTPLGSAANEECRIDALAQAWAVIAGAAPADRAIQAMDAVEQHLVSETGGLIRLLTPPFDKTPHDPGYIKGYVPGVRENGGQYTHAATWVVRALAELGRTERAARLLAMLSPVSHARTVAETAVYQVEPYVVAADVYGVSPHLGRGGWTWYTGSAGWLYRVAMESVLGFRLMDGDKIGIKPCVPADWPQFSLRYRLPGGTTEYQIQVLNPTGHTQCVVAATCDGVPVDVENGAACIPLTTDGAVHTVCVTLGAGG